MVFVSVAEAPPTRPASNKERIMFSVSGSVFCITCIVATVVVCSASGLDLDCGFTVLH